MTREEINIEIARLKEKAMDSPDRQKYRCPICKDQKGFIFDLNGADTWIKCECADRQLAIDRMNRSGIIEEDRNRTLADYNTFGEKALQEAKETVKRYMVAFPTIKAERNNSLLIMGRSGSGKTMLGIIAAMHIIKAHATGLRYVSYRDMIMHLKQNIMDEYKYNLELQKLYDAPVLFIDDLFKGKITESDVSIMYGIINARYLKRMPLIISTECSVDRLMEIDEAIASRLIEMSKGHIIMFGADIKNYRMR